MPSWVGAGAEYYDGTAKADNTIYSYSLDKATYAPSGMPAGAQLVLAIRWRHRQIGTPASPFPLFTHPGSPWVLFNTFATGPLGQVATQTQLYACRDTASAWPVTFSIDWRVNWLFSNAGTVQAYVMAWTPRTADAVSASGGSGPNNPQAFITPTSIGGTDWTTNPVTVDPRSTVVATFSGRQGLSFIDLHDGTHPTIAPVGVDRTFGFTERVNRGFPASGSNDPFMLADIDAPAGGAIQLPYADKGTASVSTNAYAFEFAPQLGGGFHVGRSGAVIGRGSGITAY